MNNQKNNSEPSIGMVKPILAVSGAINWDISLYVSKFAEPGEEVEAKRIERIPGGKGANVAVAAARILGKGQSAIIGGIGNDEIGNKQTHVFEDEGVNIKWLLEFNDMESGQAYIVIDEKGENQINTYFGANWALNGKHAEYVKDIFNSVKCLVLIDPPIEFSEELLSEAKGIIKIWLPGVKILSNKDSILAKLNDISYLVVNEHELKNLFGSDNTEETYKIIRDKNINLKIIVTRGSSGVTLITRTSSYSVKGIDLNELGLKVVNTVGCGDAFLGAFASYLILGYEEEKALTVANLAGALKATRYETRGSPTNTELESYFRKLYGTSIS